MAWKFLFSKIKERYKRRGNITTFLRLNGWDNAVIVLTMKLLYVYHLDYKKNQLQSKIGNTSSLRHTLHNTNLISGRSSTQVSQNNLVSINISRYCPSWNSVTKIIPIRPIQKEKGGPIVPRTVAIQLHATREKINWDNPYYYNHKMGST